MRPYLPLLWILLLCFTCPALGQVRFISPLPGGIMQVHGNIAHCKVHIETDRNVATVELHMGSDFDTASPAAGWFPIKLVNGIGDTLLTVPTSPHHYSLSWRTDSASNLSGSISDLTPGHVIGIAGQSNAEGTTWEMIQTADGDERMLRDAGYWQPAHEPTGHAGGGPWIAMANELWNTLNDTLPIGIVNVAVGGTGIVDDGPAGKWVRNPAHPDDSSIYGNAVRKFRQAGGELEALFWIQGESDGAFLNSPDDYRLAFKGLMDGLRQDIPDSFPIYHLQISGNSRPGAAIASLPLVREAERDLPPSTICGTAVGRAIEEGDGLHFTVTTCYAVAHAFAGAVLTDGYHLASNYYPALIPDSVAQFDSLTDGTILGKYCFGINWSRGGHPVTLANVHGSQAFTITKDGQEFDTSLVWMRISTTTPGRVLVGLRNDSITLDHNWELSYVSTAGADRAPLANIIGTDTVFGVAFFGRPVVSHPSSPPASVKGFDVITLAPNPTAGLMNCEVVSGKPQMLHVELRNNLGILMQEQETYVEIGTSVVPIPTVGLAAGNYWILIRSASQQFLQKMVVLN